MGEQKECLLAAAERERVQERACASSVRYGLDVVIGDETQATLYNPLSTHNFLLSTLDPLIFTLYSLLVGKGTD